LASFSAELIFLAEHDLSDEPVGGCPVGSDVATTAEISPVVQTVVAELK
jgi:hypothetical protein